jgi:hypothetical protein
MKPARAVWLGILFAICVTRLWLMALPSSFWVDETVTAFVVERPHDPSLAVAPQVPASIYYWLPRLAVKLGGASEAGYRVPSVLAMLAAIWIVARLAARLVHPQAGWFAAFACLGLKGIDYFAVDARPYALGMLTAAAAVWFLVSWLDGARWRDALGFTVFAALVWRVHLVYWPFYLVLALYPAVRLARGKTAVVWRRAAAVFALLGLALVPVALQAWAIERQARAHVIVMPPSWRDFLHLLRWNLVLIAGAGAWVVGRASRIRNPDPVGQTVDFRGLPGSERQSPPAGDENRSSAPRANGEDRLSGLLIFAWWLAPPAALYAISLATGQSVYVTRYLSLALPGAALAATWAASRWLPAGWWQAAAALVGLGAIAALGQWTTAWPEHEKSNWRAAAAEINRLESAADLPVICTSPFIEARWPVWRPDYPLPGFLYADLAYYPIRGKLVLFPFEDAHYLTPGGRPLAAGEPRAEVYAAQLLGGPLTAHGGFLIYGGSNSIRFWQKWFAARPELKAWKNRRDELGDVFVARFWAPR